MLLLGAFLVASIDSNFDPGPHPLLMRHPTLSKTSIAFQFAGDLWSVSRAGGKAHRLTSAPGVESNPYFSPDGTMIAFSGRYDGNEDVFVIPAEGGVPKRLTAHPDADTCLGWTPDSKSVIFSSSMLSNTDDPRAFTVAATGGIPKPLPFPSVVAASMSPDGSQLAYTPIIRWEEAWKRYRGGQTAPVWIGQISDSRVKEIPRENTDDKNPMWVGDKVFYLCDKRGPVGLWSYDTKTGREAEEIAGDGFDLKSACAGPGAIVYERLGGIYLFDLGSHTSKRVSIEIDSDFPELRPEFKNVARNVRGVSLSPSGQRALVCARGWLFSVPAAKGNARLMDDRQGIDRHDAVWSPDGKTIAYVTDEDGNQRLALYDVSGGTTHKVDLGEEPGVYGDLTWSPDSSKIAYTDNKLNLWSYSVATALNEKIDTGWYRGPSQIRPRWSPDSKWLTWSRDLPNHYDAIFLYDFANKKRAQITDGLSDATTPVFSSDGKHLFFEASTDVGIASDFEDMSQMENSQITESLYAVVLRADGENPLHPESDEEVAKKPAPAKQDFRIDLDGIEHRIIDLPMPQQSYGALEAGPDGSLFAISSGGRRFGPSDLMKFSFSDRKAKTFAPGVFGFQMSPDGSKVLLQRGGAGSIVSSAGDSAGPGQEISLADLQVKVDPRVEWRHLYHECWAKERMLFYDPNMHGADTRMLERRYEPYLDGICSRDDLNYLFTDMLGELTVGHMFIGGGDIPGVGRGVPGGLLGADYTFENHRYRIARVYDGERWNPGLYAPLSQPGVNAKAGEYILAIDGRDLTEVNDIYEALEDKAGKQVKVKIGPSPDGVGSREAIVVPVGSEFELRFRAWSEDNRRLVEKMTGGRGGYVHVPDTGGGGWSEFNRYYYAQSGRDGMIIDDRFNHGGLINDYMVNEMMKPLDFGSHTRYGHDYLIPPAAVYGPKVMLINEAAGSGGDIFPFLFHQRGAGKLVGKRTWGAMLTAYGFQLTDGGSIRAPDDAMYNPKTGQWVIENVGTPPDYDVPLDPYLWRQGRDSQLEKAIEVLNEELANYHPTIRKPGYPDKSKLPPP